MPAPALPNATNCNCLAVRQAARYMTQFYDRYLGPSGIRTTQHGILAKLKRGGPMSINALATELVMDPHHARPQHPAARARRPDRDRGRSIRPAQQGPAPDQNRGSAFPESPQGWEEAQKQFERAYGGKQASHLRDMLRGVVASDLGTQGTQSPRHSGISNKIHVPQPSHGNVCGGYSRSRAFAALHLTSMLPIKI